MAEMREDLIRGWFYYGNGVQNLFNDPATHVSTLTTNVKVQTQRSDGTYTDPSVQPMEQAGVIYSAVNNNNTLGMLLSNMDTNYHIVNFADTFGPGTLNMDIGLAPGIHLFVRFALNNGHWQAFDYSAMNNNNNARSGVGIPEPGTFSLMAGAGALVLLRRRRRQARR